VDFSYYDLGRLERGSTVVVTMTGNAANVRLMTASNYNSYKSGRQHHYYGGLAEKSPVRLAVPSTDHYFVTLDMQGLSGTVRHKVQVLPPPQGPLPPIRQTGVQPQPLSQIRHTVDPEIEADPEKQVWDVFISHATEDKDTVALPLATALQAHGISVWLDVLEMKIGDSLRRKIDAGLAGSRFGVVVLSPAFLRKKWTQYELDGLVTMQVSGEQSMLPIWHQISHAEVRAASPSLADKVARSTADLSVDEIAAEIAEVVKRPPSS
jgi:Domain of unknown function (DUF1883)/TIR domain